jgi:hypothetical protein
LVARVAAPCYRSSIARARSDPFSVGSCPVAALFCVACCEVIAPSNPRARWSCEIDRCLNFLCNPRRHSSSLRQLSSEIKISWALVSCRIRSPKFYPGATEGATGTRRNLSCGLGSGARSEGRPTVGASAIDPHPYSQLRPAQGTRACWRGAVFTVTSCMLQ